MKKFSFLSLTLFCVLAFSSFASAQAATGGRVAVINTERFGEEKAGITKYVNAIKAVETEFAPAIKELDTLAARLQTLEKEINALRQSGAAADQQTGQRKMDEYEKLQRDYKRRQEDAKSRYDRRFTAVTTPLNQSIGTALTEFAKKNNYSIVFDISRDKEGLVVSIPDEKIDITKDFIAFFNARQ